LPGPSPLAEDAVEVETEVLEVVSGMLVDVIGPEYLIGLTIDLDTSFDGDLELESLEFVALAERLLGHYGEAVDFVAWLATMELDEIIALTVGDLVTFIVSAISGALGTT
jgi:acyl carrier protein